MLNLRMMNMAAGDEQISSSEFRVLYVISNAISPKKGETAQWHKVYVEVIADRTAMTGRNVRRCIDGLVEKDYLDRKVVAKNDKKELYLMDKSGKKHPTFDANFVQETPTFGDKNDRILTGNVLLKKENSLKNELNGLNGLNVKNELKEKSVKRVIPSNEFFLLEEKEVLPF